MLLLLSLVAVLALVAAQDCPCSWGSNLVIPPPTSPSDQPAWLATWTAWRNVTKAQYAYNGSVYDDFLHWSERMFVAPQSHVYDQYLFNSTTGQWTVDVFLADLTTRYGGIDGVLLWGTYPNMGVDERNQYQITFDDLPGGMPALQSLVNQFHERGVRVGFPYNPWDIGTTPSNASDNAMLAVLSATADSDFVNGDTMCCIPEAFWNSTVSAGQPLAYQPEGETTIFALPWTKMGWGESDEYSEATVPPVSVSKWLERRHLTQIVDRWATDHTIDILVAFFNGIGFVSWENVWGIWNGLSDRDAESVRRYGALESFLAPYLVSENWVPYTILSSAASSVGVYASTWPSPAGVAFPNPSTAWTIVNMNTTVNVSGPILPVPCSPAPAALYYDVYGGVPLPVVSSGDEECALNVTVEAGGFRAIIAISTDDSPASNTTFTSFLSTMEGMTSLALALYSSAVTILPQTMADNGATPPSPDPSGMVLLPANNSWLFEVQGTEIEGQFLAAGCDVQFPWEPLPVVVHSHVINFPTLLIDMYPVTNAQYSAFLNESGYAPTDAHNFLLDWGGSTSPPPGYDNKPVTWVDFTDATAYCNYYGKRLPNDWEWQRAAQGDDGRTFPWGDTLDWSNIPPQANGRTRPPPPDVGSYPQGASPFGMQDAMGLVWQWTNAFADIHTHSGLVRGGSYYRPIMSYAPGWYFPNLRNDTTQGDLALFDALLCFNAYLGVLVTVATHNKLLTMAPSYDRHGTVGFRCAADV